MRTAARFAIETGLAGQKEMQPIDLTEANLHMIANQVGHPFGITRSGLVRDARGNDHSAQALLVAERGQVAAEREQVAALEKMARSFPKPIPPANPVADLESFFIRHSASRAEFPEPVTFGDLKAIPDVLSTPKGYTVGRLALTDLLERIFSERTHAFYKILADVVGEGYARDFDKYKTTPDPVEAATRALFIFEEYRPFVQDLIDHLRGSYPQWRNELEDVRVSGLTVNDARLVPTTHINNLVRKFRELRMAPPDHIIREMLYASELHPELAAADKLVMIKVMLSQIGDNPNQVWLVRNLVAVVDYLSRDLRGELTKAAN